MKTDFSRETYTTVFQQIEPAKVTLTANAAAAVVATFDTSFIQMLTVTLDVAGAALTGLEVWGRGDKNGRWFPLEPEQAIAYGRTDPGTDVRQTPAGAACFLMIGSHGWSDIQIKAKSAGAAVLTISAGGK